MGHILPRRAATFTGDRNEYVLSQVKGSVGHAGQKLAVVVTGGTGKQGGAVVKSLLERGHAVRAVTRSTDSAEARELANAGVTLVRASLEDHGRAQLRRPRLEGGDLPLRDDDAIRRRHASRDAARHLRRERGQAAGVHLVFTSVGSANRRTGVPHFDSKYEVEKHIARTGVRATVLAPVFFMENLYFGKEHRLARRHLHVHAAPADETSRASRRCGHRGRRRLRPREPRPLRRQALRPRGRRAHGQRRRRHPLACHRSPVHLFPGPAGRHPPTHG